ncbi:maspardin-like [Impatiens glandulifera]|uniref:maspardin-like n=1 Tax=Impatiens glandulifera TaxID=253017 RepID=UPI001FB176BA|nr:maspardin-like [Impatiens glandulifera]
MKGVFSAPGDYIYFKSQVPLHKIPIGSKQWRYYDFGPKSVPPLICLPGIAGTADVFYKQIMSLSMKGYRVISVDIPRVWNHKEWMQAFEKFLDTIDVHHVHLYGTSLGGFLAQLFAQYRPRRVKSLILSNSFLETHKFSAAMPWAPIVGWTPSFLLKRYVLMGISSGPSEPFIADSVDFVVAQIESLHKDDLASRLHLAADTATVGSLSLSDSFITIMDTNDHCATPQQLKDAMIEQYPEARKAYLKTGGDFPFLSRPDEVNLHLQLHLRRVGVEAQTNMVCAVEKDNGVDSSGENRNEGQDDDDSWKDAVDGLNEQVELEGGNGGSDEHDERDLVGNEKEAGRSGPSPMDPESSSTPPVKEESTILDNDNNKNNTM